MLRYGKNIIHRIRKTNGEKIKQKLQVKNLPNLFWLRKRNQPELRRAAVGLGHQTLLISHSGEVKGSSHKIFFVFGIIKNMTYAPLNPMIAPLTASTPSATAFPTTTRPGNWTEYNVHHPI
jgi:hypothetical protein